MVAWREGIAVWAAIIGLAIAGFLSSLPPASECSTAHKIHWLLAAPFFSLFVVAGAYAIVKGSVAQRIILFIAVAMIIAGYVTGLSSSLPMVFETEISCAAQGGR
jgi:hypothetical protein